MIQVHRLDSGSAAHLKCDICGERIENAGGAAAVYSLAVAPNSDSDVLHVHKRECHSAADARIRQQGGRPAWVEMQEHLAQLIHNTGSSALALVEFSAAVGEFFPDEPI